MSRQSYAHEATHCRALAQDFADRPESPFLLRAADVFDDLASQDFQTTKRVIGPLGELLTLESLPAADTHRWTARRKAEVVAAVEGGLLTIHEACARYSLSIEELTSWQRAVHRSGMPGLRITRIQHYREFYERHDHR